MANAVTSRHVERWLGKILQIELVDGRLIQGRFVCTDNHPNIILAGAEERWSEQESSSEEISPSEEEIPSPDDGPRQIGLVMIAREHFRKSISAIPRLTRRVSEYYQLCHLAPSHMVLIAISLATAMDGYEVDMDELLKHSDLKKTQMENWCAHLAYAISTNHEHTRLKGISTKYVLS
ncbi:unnamed protein product, partial [Mesorhabditis belari]|uniref:Sm domain-containing protein n=1 Tax=Mesorhabditis belari TaxID=2138241 RepID=A0AAF3F4M1_9BILA